MKLFRISIALVIACSVLFISCDKEFKKIPVEDFNTETPAKIRVYNGVPTSVRNHVFVDGAAATGLAIAFLELFPATGQYAVVNPGNHNIVIKDTTASTGQTQVNFSADFGTGKYYSIFVYDTTTAVKYKLVEDNIVIPSDTSARLRFANLVYSATPVPNVDVYSVKKGANIFTNLAVADVTDFIPYASLITDSIYVRETGTTTDLAPVLTITPNVKRSYTVVFRGRWQTTSGTSTSIRRHLSAFTTN